MEGTRCVIPDYYESARDNTPELVDGYTLDDGSAYGIASTDRYRIYYK